MINLKNKNVLVMGLGLVGGGLGVTKWLYRQGAKITITDLRNKKTLAPTLKKLKGLNIKYVLGRHRKRDFERANLVIKNPGVAINSPYLKIAQKNHVPVETDLSLFLKLWPGRVIAITGTKGKTTTAHLAYQMLKSTHLPVNLAGNVGQTPLQFIRNSYTRPVKYQFGEYSRIIKYGHLNNSIPASNFKLSNGVNKKFVISSQIMVLELSSFQLEAIKPHFHIAAITNIYPDHLNRHKTMQNYINIKTNIFKYQTANDFTILNYDNKNLKAVIKKTTGRLVLFSQKISNLLPKCYALFYIKKDAVFLKTKKINERVVSLKKIKLPGKHNLENILAGVAIAYLSGIKKSIIQKTITNFAGMPNRLELVRIIKGVKYYNDTTATNPGAAIAALKALGQSDQLIGNKNISPRLEPEAHQPWAETRPLRQSDSEASLERENIVLICGGADKNLNFNELSLEIKKTCKQVIMLSGAATPRFIQTLKRVKYPSKNITEFDNFKKAIYFAKKIAENGDVVLLSPACASFGMFANEFDRGKQFVKIVKKL